MADGYLNFDTQVNNDGMSQGVKELKDILKSLDTTIKSLATSIEKVFSSVDTSNVTKDANDTSIALENVAATSDDASNSAKNVALSFEQILEQMQNIPISHWNEAANAIDDVDMSVENLKNDLNQIDTEANSAADAVNNIGMESDSSFSGATQEATIFNNMLTVLRQTFGDIPLILNLIGNRMVTAFNNDGTISKTNAKVEKLTQRIDILKDHLNKLEEQGLYFGNGDYDATYKKLVTAQNELNKYKKSLTDVDTEQKKVTKSAKTKNTELKKTSKNTKNANTATGGLIRSLKLLKMSLMFSLAFRAFSAVTEGIKTGIQNLAQYSNDFNQSMSLLKSSLTQFKNSIGAAFAPLITVAIPYLVTFIDYLSKTATILGQFFAALTGKDTFTQAKKVVENYAKSINKTAKDANRLYSFDRAEVANKKQDTGNADIADMFTTGKISQNILDAVNQFKAMIADLFKPVQDAWNEYGKGVIDSFWIALDNIKAVISDIGQSFYNVWTNGTGYETVSNILILLTTILGILGAIALAFNLAWNDGGAGESLIQSIFNLLNAVLVLINSIGIAFLAVWSNGTGQDMLGFILSILTNIVDTVTNLVTQFTDAWNSASTGQQIFQNIADVINTLMSYVDKITGAMADWASNIDFSPLLTSIKDFTASLEPLAGTLGEALYWFFTEVLLPLGSFVIEDALPVFFDLLGSAIEFVNSVLEALSPLASWLWDSFLQPIAAWTGGAIIDILTGLANALKAISDWISQNQSLFEAFVVVVLSFMAAWKIVNVALIIGQIIGALVTFIATGGLATAVTTALGAAIAFLTSPVTIVIAIIGALIAIIVLLVKNWDKVKEVAAAVWEGIVNAWKGAGDWFKNTVTEPIKNLFNKWAPLIGAAAVLAWKMVGDAFSDAGDWFMDNVIDPIIGGFEKLQNGVKGIINGIIGFFEGMVNGVIGGVNLIISALNSLNFNIPSWVPLIGGKSFGFNIPTVSEKKLPRLATGTVVPRNNGEFAAILGDNKVEPEVVSPVSTIEKAVENVLARSGFNNNNNRPIYLQVDGKTFAQIMNPYFDNENERLGARVIQGGMP